MKKYIFLALLLAFSLTGCGSKSNSVTSDSAVNTEESERGHISDELTHHAYEVILSLSIATMSTDLSENNIVLEDGGDTKTFILTDASYLNGETNASASGTMISITGETEDQSKLELKFSDDPMGLETVTLTSSGLTGETHSEGTFVINGKDKPFIEFIEYLAAKGSKQDINPVDSPDTSPES